MSTDYAGQVTHLERLVNTYIRLRKIEPHEFGGARTNDRGALEGRDPAGPVCWQPGDDVHPIDRARLALDESETCAAGHTQGKYQRGIRLPGCLRCLGKLARQGNAIQQAAARATLAKWHGAQTSAEKRERAASAMRDRAEVAAAR